MSATARHPILRAIGTATPESSVAQDLAAEALARVSADPEAARKARVLGRRSRIARRSSVLGTLDALTPLGKRLLDPDCEPPRTSERMEEYARLAPALARAAATAAFARDRVVGPGDVTHVIVVSCTGFLAPGLDVLLARDLGIPARAGRTLVGFQGCHAALSALRLAEAIARADDRAAVLACCVELCTLHLQRAATDDAILAGTLFADGAAAAIVGGAALRPPVEQAPLRIARTATRLVPDTLGGMAWRVGDTGFEMGLSAYVPDLLGHDAKPALQEMLGLRDAEIGSLFWAVHPGGAAILDALERALGLPAPALSPSRDVLARHGNMSSATVLFVLEEILRRGGRGPGIALAFGPGLTIEACRLEPAP